MTDWAHTALGIALASAVATSGCMSSTPVHPASLEALGNADSGLDTVTLSRPNGWPVTVDRGVDAVLVMRDGLHDTFRAPVSTLAQQDGTLSIRDARHEERLRLTDIASARVESVDSESGAVGAVIALVVVGAVIAGIAVIAASIPGDPPPSPPPPTDTSWAEWD